MKKRKFNLLQRILIKANAVTYTAVGKVADMCKRIGVSGKFPYSVSGHFGEVIEVSHPYPVNFKAEDEPLFQEWKWYQTFPHDLFVVKDTWLTSDGIVLRKHLTFIKTLPHPVFRYKYGILYNLKARLMYRKEKSNPEKKYLLLYDNWSWNNYFHWIIDALCRAELVRRNLNEKFTILLPEASPKYLTETLKHYGYTDFEYLPEGSMIKTDTLYSMNYAAWSGQQHPEILRSMVNYVKSVVSSKSPDGTNKIYVSRSRQFSRRISNENELLPILKKYGFEVHYFEGMSFADQITLMQSARYFVSSHGANMTNLIFLPERARILELLNNRKPNFCYWSVASSLQQPYYYQLCEIESADHLLVDLAAFENNLKLMLSVPD